tara:strand:- start:7 stop:438 length:432 start_codon:yes stop_codon:yes gene_type:complete
MPKISQYTTMSTLQDGDLFDVSQDQLDGTFVTKAISWEDILIEINATISGTNIYADNGTLTADREMDMDNNNLTFANPSGIGIGGLPDPHVILDISAIEDKTVSLPIGTTLSRPGAANEGEFWFNTTTKQFEGFNGTNWVIIG